MVLISCMAALDNWARTSLHHVKKASVKSQLREGRLQIDTQVNYLLKSNFMLAKGI